MGLCEDCECEKCTKCGKRLRKKDKYIYHFDKYTWPCHDRITC